jgi:hypothetical protein
MQWKLPAAFYSGRSFPTFRKTNDLQLLDLRLSKRTKVCSSQTSVNFYRLYDTASEKVYVNYAVFLSLMKCSSWDAPTIAYFGDPTRSVYPKTNKWLMFIYLPRQMTVYKQNTSTMVTKFQNHGSFFLLPISPYSCVIDLLPYSYLKQSIN